MIFDIAGLAIMALSAVMSLGRGLIREAFSVVSFIVGGTVAILAIIYLKEPLRNLFGTKDDLIPVIVLFLIGFLAAYTAAAFLGGRLSKLIHASPEIGVLDRLAGAAFGVARGFVALVLLVLLVKQLVPEGEPDWIYKSWSYKMALGPASDWAGKTVPGIITDLIRLLNSGAAPAQPAP